MVRPDRSAPLRQRSTCSSRRVGLTRTFCRGRRATPGTVAATSQELPLISITHTSVLNRVQFETRSTNLPRSPRGGEDLNWNLRVSNWTRFIMVESDERFGQVVGLGHGAPPSVSAQRWCLRPRRSPHSFFRAGPVLVHPDDGAIDDHVL